MSDDPSGTNGVPAGSDPEPIPPVMTAETTQNAPERQSGAFTGQVVKRTYKKVYRPTGNPVGRPTKAVVAERKRLAAERAREANPRGHLPKLGPEVPKGLGWGGKRSGSGRPRSGPAKHKVSMGVARLDGEIGEKLKAMPKGQRSEYLRQAVDLMKDILPPEKFLASGKKKQETEASDS